MRSLNGAKRTSPYGDDDSFQAVQSQGMGSFRFWQRSFRAELELKLGQILGTRTSSVSSSISSSIQIDQSDNHCRVFVFGIQMIHMFLFYEEDPPQRTAERVTCITIYCCYQYALIGTVYRDDVLNLQLQPDIPVCPEAGVLRCVLSHVHMHASSRAS